MVHKISFGCAVVVLAVLAGIMARSAISAGEPFELKNWRFT